MQLCKFLVFITGGCDASPKISGYSDDHFVTVGRLAGALILAGHSVEINHFEKPDIIIDGKIAVEYERPGSHSFDEICQKRDAALAKYSEVFFVCQAQNYEQISKAVGEERTIQRGKDLREWIEKR